MFCQSPNCPSGEIISLGACGMGIRNGMAEERRRTKTRPITAYVLQSKVFGG